LVAFGGAKLGASLHSVEISLQFLNLQRETGCARVEGVPAAAEIDFDPCRKIHRRRRKEIPGDPVTINLYLPSFTPRALAAASAAFLSPNQYG
jgi:hypothetical protein